MNYNVIEKVAYKEQSSANYQEAYELWGKLIYRATHDVNFRNLEKLKRWVLNKDFCEYYK